MVSAESAGVSEMSPKLRLSEVSKHNTNDDCWIIVNSKIWDVSSFHAEHPGGSAIIMKYAGADATAAYDEIHAPGILEGTLEPKLLIGYIDQKELQASVEAANKKSAKASRPAKKVSAATVVAKPEYVKPDLVRLISVHDFEEVARETFTPKAFAFYSSAATDLVTHHSNSEFYRRIMIRPRVMRNVKEVSIRRSILGCDSSAPFFISPAAMARMAHPDGELAMARGCASEGIIQIVIPPISHHRNPNILPHLIRLFLDIFKCLLPTIQHCVSRCSKSTILPSTICQRGPQ